MRSKIIYLLLVLAVQTRARCPSGCTCIGKRVECTKILNLEDVPVDTEFLGLSNNSIGERITLSMDSFTSLTSLKTLILSDNQLESLPQGLFNKLKSLHTLNLSNNDLGERTALSKGTFTPLTSLKILSLSHNQFEWFEEGLFETLTSLQTLDISHNPLSCGCDLVDVIKPLKGRMNIVGAWCWLDAEKRSLLNLTCSHLPDNCFADKNKCHRKAECDVDEDDASNSFCRCKHGFEGTGIKCSDINECEEEEDNDCHRRAHCINTIGSYKCRCGEFYKGNGTYCEDINDCLKPDRCKPDELCQNVDGGFNCNCRRGYTKTSPHPASTCRDINECTETTKCSKLVNCTNKIGSYRCGRCPEGYVGDGRYCNVACKLTKCWDGSFCYNTPSGPLCRCPLGLYHHKNKCVTGSDIIKIQHLKVRKYYTRGLRRFNSPAFLEVARKMEPVILSHLRSNFSSILNVHVVRIVRGGSWRFAFVDLVVLVGEDRKPLSGQVELAMQQGLKKGKLKFNGMYVGNSFQTLNVKYTNKCDLGLYHCGEYFKCVVITSLSYKCECQDGYLLEEGRCVENHIVRNIVIGFIALLSVGMLFVGIVCMRKKKKESEKPLSMREKKITEFTNAAFHTDSEYEEETTTL